MEEIGDLKRLEDQLYQYHPELLGDSEDMKLKRRNRLFMQLQSSQPEVQLVALDAVSSLTNIKNILETCRNVVQDYSHVVSLTPGTMSPAMSLIESSGDEFLGAQRPRRTVARKRRTPSIYYNSSEMSKLHCSRKDDSPLSLSILIPQVVKGSEKMEISIDLGELDASQRLFASRVDELLRKRSNSSHIPDYAPLKENLNSNKCKDLQLPIAASSTIEANNVNNENQEEEMLSRLISQVLVENHDAETLQATNLLDNINNNERSNYNADVPDALESSKKQMVKKKRQRKPKKSVSVDKGPPKKRGRKPKNKSDQQSGLEFEVAKSDLAKYVELFSNSCNMTGSTTPAASSTVSQQLVTSTTHYLDTNDQQPITYYLEGDWENGGNCQLVQTDSAHVDGGQEEFNMAELVNYIDNVGDAGNAIARVLDDPPTVPILSALTQESEAQSNSIVPPPAHVSDVLLDLSKKSTISYSLYAPDNINVNTETGNHDIMPLDLSLKSAKRIQTPISKTNSVSLETSNFVAKSNGTTDGVFEDHEYASFGAALDMPLIDLEDNINAFMQLTNNEIITTGPVAETTSTNCETAAHNTLPICTFELGEILTESNLCNNNNYNHVPQINAKINYLDSQVVNNANNNYNHNSLSNSKINDLNSDVNSGKTERNGNALDQRNHDNDIPKFTESLINLTTNVIVSNDTANVGKYEDLPQRNSEATFSQDSNREQYHGELSDAKQDNASNVEPKSPSLAVSSEDKAVIGIDHAEELHGDSGDLLFVDTETLVTNNDDDAPVTAYDPDTATTIAIEQDNENKEKDPYDLSATENLSKSIDLIEDHQSHNVSVNLPIPQLALMETNSEEFAYEMGLEISEEEKDAAVPDVPKNEANEANDSGQSDNLICNDSGIGNSVISDNVETEPKSTVVLFNSTSNYSTVSNNPTEEITTTATGTDRHNTDIERGKDVVKAVDSFIGTAQNLKQTSHRENNESLNKIANVSTEGPEDVCAVAVSTHHTTQRLVIESVSENITSKEPDTISNLSVLEMELKMNADCLDFEDEMEDDALSLATSCFNSSDDERCPDTNCTSEATTKVMSNNSIENNEHTQYEKSAAVKVEVTQCSTDVPIEVLKKFKIPKIAMTTATAKHGGPTENVATAAALPMVILPPNAFNKQLIKTEPDGIKPVNCEKITRTVQNVCAVTPLTLQQPTYQSQNTIITQNSFNTIKPLLRDMVQLPTSSNESDVKDLKTVDNNKQIVCRRNELVGIDGDCQKSSGHTLAIANTFGVTCLPFLVNRCFKLGNCDFSHKFRDPEAVGDLLLTFSEVDLNIAYRFTYNHELLFRRYMHELCRVYSVRNNRLKLLHMARDCERYPSGGKLLVTIFHSLEYCGLNKVNACRQILSYSRDRSQETIDVLLDIILEADWTMFCDYIEKFVDIASYKFRVNVLQQMAPTILNANDQQMTSLFFKCLVNLHPNDVRLVQSSPILMQLLELIKNGQICK